MRTLQIFLTVLVCSILTSKRVTAFPVTTLLNTAKEVISFGLDVYSFFGSIFGKDDIQTTPTPIDYDRIINSISERIEMSTDTIVFKIELHAYISEFRDVALTVKQLLGEMEGIVKAKSKGTRDELQRRFRDNFDRHKTEIYKVKSLLTFSVDVSGISNTLLSLIANEFKCGMTSLEEFQNYYMTLVSDVVALALLNERLSEKSLYNSTVASWQTAIESLFKNMEEQKNKCKGKFFELVKEDFSAINDPLELFESNQNRYPYRKTNVLHLSGSYCLWSLKNDDKLLKKVEDNAMTFVLIGEEENERPITQPQFQKLVSNTKFGNSYCMGDIGKILSFVDVLDKDLVFWLMYPQSQAAGIKILLDQNSTARTITTESDGTKYTTLVYLRAHTPGSNSTQTLSDFDAQFKKAVPVEEETSGLKAWELGLIIGFSVLVFIIVCICICCCCCG